MARKADVRSLEALKQAKAAIAEFRDSARAALSEAHSEAQRTLWWLQQTQATHWQQEYRRRVERVNHAKSELYRAQLAAMDPEATCLEQRKALEMAQRSVREAEAKIKAVKQWTIQLDRELTIYRGQTQRINHAIEGDLPKAEAALSLMMDRLDAYIRTQIDQGGPARSTADDSKSGGDEKKENGS
jgi:chromosome segregation ATPase